MKHVTRLFLAQIIVFSFFLTGLQNAKAMVATFDTATSILIVPALKIDSTLHNVTLQLGNDGCLTLLSDTPAAVAFSGAVYNPATLTATLPSVEVGNQLFQATIRFENGCFRVASAFEIEGILRYADAEVTGQVASGDFNGDSFIDLAFTIRTLPGHVSGSNNDMIRVIFGNGTGAFSGSTDIFRISSSDSNKRGHQLIAGDFDGDNIDDFANSSGRILQVFSGNAANTPQLVFNNTDTPGAPLYSFDVDGNGFNDFISIVFGGSTRSLFNLNRNFGNGSFGAVEFISSADDPDIRAIVGSPLNFTVGDFNGDTVEDILAVLTNGSGNDTGLALALFTGNGDGSFNNPASINLISDDLFLGESVFDEVSKEIIFGDFDGDGDNDIAMTSTTSFVQIFLNNGSGQFSAAQRVQVGNKPIHVRVADFDNDGIDDLASVNANSRTVVISLGNGDGTFADITDNSGRAISIQLDGEVDLFDMDVVDLNADGFPDIIIAEDGTNPPDTGRGSIQILLAPGQQ